MTRLGRKPQGAALVTPLAGSEHAKRRLTLFLQTLSGECSVGEACAELGIGESRFFAQRGQWLQESLAMLEPRSAGRPTKPEPSVSTDEAQALRERVRELEARAAAVEVQSELARTLPHVIHRLRPGKKTKRPAHRQGWRSAPRP
jgi:hypothetical protein